VEEAGAARFARGQVAGLAQRHQRRRAAAEHDDRRSPVLRVAAQDVEGDDLGVEADHGIDVAHVQRHRVHRRLRRDRFACGGGRLSGASAPGGDHVPAHVAPFLVTPRGVTMSMPQVS
jgi:hypothetical protein